MTTLHPRGEVDMATVAVFERALERGTGPDRDLVVDLSELTFIDVWGLRALARAAAREQAAGRRLALTRPNHNVRRLLRLAGLGDLIH
jgi:anti-anti-sigma factor